MALNLGPSSTFSCSHVKTSAGTNIITKNGTLVASKGFQTAAGTSLMTAAGKFNPGQTTGYKVPLTFDKAGMKTNTTTYCNIPGGSGNISSLDSYYDLATGTSQYGHIPWAGSVLSLGVHCRSPRTAGYCSFTVMNGGTSLVTVTLNSTNTKLAASAILSQSAKLFTANNLRVKVRSSAAWAPTVTNPFSGIVWLEV